MIFISYRRKDVPDSAGRLADALTAKFGARRLFMDVVDIPLGINFESVLEQKLNEATAMIVVIGPNWLNLATWDDRDIVLHEIKSAFRRKILIVPVLAGNARMPTPNQLPANITSLATLNACDMSAPGVFSYVVNNLVERVRGSLISQVEFIKLVLSILGNYRGEDGLSLGNEIRQRAMIHGANLAHLPVNPGTIHALVEFAPGWIKGAQVVAIFTDSGMHYGGPRPGGAGIYGFLKYAEFAGVSFGTTGSYLHVAGAGRVNIDAIDIGPHRVVVEQMNSLFKSSGFEVGKFIRLLDQIKDLVISRGAPP